MNGEVQFCCDCSIPPHCLPLMEPAEACSQLHCQIKDCAAFGISLAQPANSKCICECQHHCLQHIQGMHLQRAQLLHRPLNTTRARPVLHCRCCFVATPGAYKYIADSKQACDFKLALSASHNGMPCLTNIRATVLLPIPVGQGSTFPACHCYCWCSCWAHYLCCRSVPTYKLPYCCCEPSA